MLPKHIIIVLPNIEKAECPLNELFLTNTKSGIDFRKIHDDHVRYLCTNVTISRVLILFNIPINFIIQKLSTELWHQNYIIFSISINHHDTKCIYYTCMISRIKTLTLIMHKTWHTKTNSNKRMFTKNKNIIALRNRTEKDLWIKTCKVFIHVKCFCLWNINK